MPSRAVMITEEQADWIHTNKFNLSNFVTNKLQEHIESLEKG